MATRYINSLRPGNAYDITFIIQILSVHFVWQVPNPIDSSQAKDVEEYLKQTKTPAMWSIYLKMNTTNQAEFHLAYQFSLSISLFPRTFRFDPKRHLSSDTCICALIQSREIYVSLQWRHNGRDSVSNHQPHDWLLNRLFRRKSKKTSTSLALWGAFTGDRWIPRTKGQ